MKQINSEKIIIMIIVLVSVMFGAHRVSAASVLYNAPACSIATQPGDILIDFDHSTRILSRPDAFHTYSRSANIPAGDYKITLESFDGYSDRVSTSPAQKREQYYVQFMDGSNQVARSAATSDLRDGVEKAYFKGTVNDKLTIGSKVDKVTVMHAAWPDNTTANSLIASCLVLHPLSVTLDGQCGTADGKTFSEKPTTNLCVSGSASSVSGSGPWSWTCSGSNGGSAATCQAFVAENPKPNPICGDKIIDSGEQCDDGNTTSEDGCSATCVTEVTEVTEENEDEDDEKDCNGTIGDYVWMDANSDGVQDAGEQGLRDITLKLKDARGKEIDKTHTNSKGKYEFKDLCEGTYSVFVSDGDVSSYVQTFDQDGNKNNKTDAHLHGNSDDYKKADFGYNKIRTVPATGSGNVAMILSGLLPLAGLWIYRKKLGRKLNKKLA